MLTRSFRWLGETIIERASFRSPRRRSRSLGRTPASRGLRIEELENRQLLSTLAVNSMDDGDDGTCDVSHCSLRETINAANSLAGADAIHFAIPADAVPTIRPIIELPEITEAVTIDGTTQSNGLVELDGSLLPEFGDGRCDIFTCGLFISGNGSTVRGLVINRFGNGIHLKQGSRNVIEGNLIGTDPTGLSILRNRMGIKIQDSSDNTVGGPTPSARNIISGSGHSGIYIEGLRGRAERNVIQGNFIGTDVTGTADLHNGIAGITAIHGSYNTIGGLSAEAGNLISGSRYGLSLTSMSNPPRGLGNVIVGNLIGTDVFGTRKLSEDPYTEAGVFIDSSLENTIGGTTPGARNVISGFRNGISIGGMVGHNGLTADQTGTRNVIQGNFIGTDITGTALIGNREHGVSLWMAASNTIGGVADGAGNTIAFSGSDAVWMPEITSPSVGNTILGNSIHSNGGLGINLGNDLVTPNDGNDFDTGANQRQNFPVLVSAGSLVRATFDSTPDTPFRIEFFTSPTANASGFGEGETFLQSIDVTTGSTGILQLLVRLSTPPVLWPFPHGHGDGSEHQQYIRILASDHTQSIRSQFDR
jgi:CSLREA domain-containing protein